MKIKYNPIKSEQVKSNPKRGISFEEAKEVWAHAYYEDYRSDDAEQFRIIGWVNSKLYSINL